MDAICYFSGHCPQFKEQRCIEIGFAEVSLIGSMSPEYKKMSFRCQDIDACTQLDSYGRCPIYVKAPHHP